MELKKSNMREGFLDKRYKDAFNLRATLSNNFTDIRPFIGLMKEFAEYAIEYGGVVLTYVNELQQFFYSRHMLPFIVNSTKDRYKIEELPHGKERDFLFYAWLAYLRVEEGWYWDERWHQYFSRKSLFEKNNIEVMSSEEIQKLQYKEHLKQMQPVIYKEQE